MFGFQNFGKQMMRMTAKNYSLNTSKYSFSNALTWANMETNSLISRTTPIPSLALMNIMNLRQLIEKCSQQTQLQQEVKKIIENNILFIIGIGLNGLMKHISVTPATNSKVI